MRGLNAAMTQPVLATDVLRTLRMVKDPAEIDALRARGAVLAKRLEAMPQSGDSFYERVRKAKEKGEVLKRTVQTGFDRETGRPVYEDEVLELEPMPFIVVVVGGMGNLGGSILASIFISLLESYASIWVSPNIEIPISTMPIVSPSRRGVSAAA